MLEKAFKIWTARQNLDAKLTFWASSVNLLWKSVVLSCFMVRFFLSILFQNEEEPKKKGLFAL